MISEATTYVTSREIARREPIYSANRFSRLIGDLPAADVTDAHLVEYRQRCRDLELSPQTIESSVSDLIAIVSSCTGSRLDPGRRLRLPPPTPTPATLEQIGITFGYCEPWLQQFIALTYWTCLRLSDVLSLQLQLSAAADSPASQHEQHSFSVIASKTQHRHEYPLPKWLRKWMKPHRLPFSQPNDFAAKITRAVLTSACRTASCDRWTPKNLRQRAVTEWMRADSTAGRIIHGCGIGVLKHYVDPLTILEQHQNKVRLPAPFATADELATAADVAVQFRRLDPEAQNLVLQTMQRFA